MVVAAVTRRQFVAGAISAGGLLACGSMFAGEPDGGYGLVAKVDRGRILAGAQRALAQPPVTVTAFHSERSSGGPHDYFSEGDYWWPDPKSPGDPYIRRDGFSNPANFNQHREALIALGILAPTLAAAWRLTRDQRYTAHLMRHLNAWFVDPATKMNPNLELAQAIFGVSKGRGTGIIDTLQLVDLVRGVRLLEAVGGLTAAEIAPIRQWFAAYVDWMAVSKNGIEERDAKNNHGTCWVLQVAEFAQFARRKDLVDLCRTRFKTAIVPDQIAKDGSLPLELARTKPYSYSLFDADVLSGICQSLSTGAEDLWRLRGATSGNTGDVVSFLYPFIVDKTKWPYPKDVEFFDAMPSRRPCLLFAGEALRRSDFLTLWQRLDANPTEPELIRNLPIRQPLLWVDSALRAV
jgi:hypothetical protein